MKPVSHSKLYSYRNAMNRDLKLKSTSSTTDIKELRIGSNLCCYIRGNCHWRAHPRLSLEVWKYLAVEGNKDLVIYCYVLYVLCLKSR